MIKMPLSVINQRVKFVRVRKHGRFSGEGFHGEYKWYHRSLLPKAIRIWISIEIGRDCNNIVKIKTISYIVNLCQDLLAGRSDLQLRPRGTSHSHKLGTRFPVILQGQVCTILRRIAAPRLMVLSWHGGKIGSLSATHLQAGAMEKALRPDYREIMP